MKINLISTNICHFFWILFYFFIQQVLLVIYFIHISVCMSISVSQFILYLADTMQVLGWPKSSFGLFPNFSNEDSILLLVLVCLISFLPFFGWRSHIPHYRSGHITEVGPVTVFHPPDYHWLGQKWACDISRTNQVSPPGFF